VAVPATVTETVTATAEAVMVAMASTRINRKGVTYEKAFHWDCGEGDSSRSHSLPDSHHNHVVHGLRTNLALLEFCNADHSKDLGEYPLRGLFENTVSTRRETDTYCI